MLQQLLDLLGGGAAPTAPARPDFKPKRPPAGTGIAQTAPKLIAHDPPLPLADALAPAHFAHPRANRRIALGGVHVAYELRRGRRRTIGFTVGAVLAPDADGRPALHLGLPHGAAPEQLRDVTQAWLMRQARRLFTERLDHFAPQLGVRWQRLGLSSAGTRWGSASADGSIRLNWRLIHFRQPVIDYVVVHELAHLREMNHGPRFWQHVQDVLPDYAERRAALKNEPVPRW